MPCSSGRAAGGTRAVRCAGYTLVPDEWRRRLYRRGDGQRGWLPGRRAGHLIELSPRRGASSTAGLAASATSIRMRTFRPQLPREAAATGGTMMNQVTLAPRTLFQGRYEILSPLWETPHAAI